MPDITIDKSSLVYDDNEFEYKTRVPGTFGEDIRYLWIKKDDVDEINEGKTYSHHWMMRVNICFMTKMIILPKQSGGQNCT